MTYLSKYECAECGKQLWKRYFLANYGCENGLEVFCSAKCGKKYIMANIEFSQEDIL